MKFEETRRGIFLRETLLGDIALGKVRREPLLMGDKILQRAFSPRFRLKGNYLIIEYSPKKGLQEFVLGRIEEGVSEEAKSAFNEQLRK